MVENGDFTPEQWQLIQPLLEKRETAPEFNKETWPDYVGRLKMDMTPQSIADAAGVSESTVYDWLTGSKRKPSIKNVVQLARGTGQSPVEALIAAADLEPEEVTGSITVHVREHLSNDELILEVSKRLKGPSQAPD